MNRGERERKPYQKGSGRTGGGAQRGGEEDRSTGEGWQWRLGHARAARQSIVFFFFDENSECFLLIDFEFFFFFFLIWN
jgi:hypothetical protein